jgi:hypothetical protein
MDALGKHVVSLGALFFLVLMNAPATAQSSSMLGQACPTIGETKLDTNSQGVVACLCSAGLDTNGNCPPNQTYWRSQSGMLGYLGGVTSPSAINDLSTGLYSPGFGQVAVSTRGQERLRVDQSGNVSITTNGADLGYGTVFNQGNGPGTAIAGIHIMPAGGGDSTAITFGANGADVLQANAGIYVQSSGAYGTRMYFATTESYMFGAIDRMMIDTQGRVGIGASVPSARLQVQGYVNNDPELILQSNGGQSVPMMQWQNANGSILGVIDIHGNVGVGTPTPGYLLDVAGDIRTTSCVHYGGGVMGNCYSDLRLKKNVKLYQDGLHEVLGLSPVTYQYNGLADNPDDGTVTVGLIAQQVKEAAPDLVGTTEVKLRPTDTTATAINTVNYAKLPYMLINAIKELNAQNAELRAEVQELRKNVEKGSQQLP